MRRTSEWVSLGHPDKMADYISCYILDRYLEKDRYTRYAVEVQIKDEYVSLAGEVTSSADFTHFAIAKFVKEAIEEIGYTSQYQKMWKKGNTIRAADVKSTVRIGQQSPDIARGVTNDGWGDQGIFWGMATKETSIHMPRDYVEAKALGTLLFYEAGRLNLGLDIKTQVTINDDGIEKVIVAAPRLGNLTRDDTVVNAIRQILWPQAKGAEIILNGTGAYSIHGPRGDAGTTGRKLAVDFYGGNCRIGGGSPWTKDGSKADLTLNLYARHLALRKLRRVKAQTVYCAIECCIGRPDIGIVYYDENLRVIGEKKESRRPEELIEMFGLREPTFAHRCREGLFHDIL